MDLSISIVNFNTKDQLRECISSFMRDAQEFACEIIVVDNASSDGSVDMVRSEFPQVKLIANSENVGATRAKNQSFAVAEGDFVLILDSDIEIKPGAVKAMVEFMRADQTVGLVAPKVFFPDGSLQHSANKRIPTLLSSFLTRLFFLAHFRYKFYKSALGDRYMKMRYSKPEEFTWFGGMALLIRADVLREIGGSDDTFFIYYDDVDFCYRVSKTGRKLFFLPSAEVVHHMSKGVKQFSAFLFPKVFESELYFFKKHHGLTAYRVCAVFIQINMLLRSLLFLPQLLLKQRRDSVKVKLRCYRNVFLLAWRALYASEK